MLIQALDDDLSGTISAVELQDFIKHGIATFYAEGAGGDNADGEGGPQANDGDADDAVGPWPDGEGDEGGEGVDGAHGAQDGAGVEGAEGTGRGRGGRRGGGGVTKKQQQIRKFKRDIDTALAPGAPVTLHATLEPARILRKSRRRRLPGANRMARSKYDVPIPGVPPPVWEALETKKGQAEELHPGIAGLASSTPPVLDELFISDLDAVLAIQWRRWEVYRLRRER